MGNKVLAEACEFIEAYPNMTTIEEFLTRFVNLPRRLPHDCVKDEIENYAQRVFAKRIEATKAPEEIDLEGGAKATVTRRDRSKPRPLVEFLEPIIDYYGRLCGFRHRVLRPTKGWISFSVSASEAKYMREKQGVPLLLRWDENGDAVVRRAA